MGIGPRYITTKQLHTLDSLMGCGSCPSEHKTQFHLVEASIPEKGVLHEVKVGVLLTVTFS